MVFFLWSTEEDAGQTLFIINNLYKLLQNYEHFENKVNKLDLLMRNLVKPESLAELKFLL